MKCDVCGRFSSSVKPVTVAIHYSLGPLRQEVCADCRSEGLTGRTLRSTADDYRLENTDV